MIIDLIVALIAVYGFYMGYSKGIIKTIFSILAIMIGLLVALKLSPFVIGFLEGLFDKQNSIIFIAGFVLTFAIVLFLIRYTGKNLEDVFKAIKLNFLNKIAGGALLSLLFIVGLSYVVWFTDRTHLIGEQTKASSITYPMLITMPQRSSKMVEKVKPFFSEFWNKTVEVVEGIKDKGEEQK